MYMYKIIEKGQATVASWLSRIHKVHFNVDYNTTVIFSFQSLDEYVFFLFTCMIRFLLLSHLVNIKVFFYLSYSTYMKFNMPDNLKNLCKGLAK